MFFFLIEQEFRLVLDGSESDEGDEGDAGASDDETGATGPPGQFTVIIYLCKTKFLLSITSYTVIFYFIIIVILLFLFCTVPPPSVVPVPDPSQADPAAAPHKNYFTSHL